MALNPLHGLGISRRIGQVTAETFEVKPGSLFPALHRMEERGWLAASWGEFENNRRAKYYRLTKAGPKQLNVEAEQWSRVSLAIARALGWTLNCALISTWSWSREAARYGRRRMTTYKMDCAEARAGCRE
jgi:PadR family transcriptional regulator PadR